jgi:dolichol-phosphate mannosyltransferase
MALLREAVLNRCKEKRLGLQVKKPEDLGLLSIVIPVRNEAENIGQLFESLASAVSSRAEVILVYDSEDDPTVREAHRQEERLRCKLSLVKNSFGHGPGNALRAGFNAAAGDAIVVVMADLSDELTLVDRMYARIQAGGDVVCGSRYMRGGRQNGGPLLKRSLSRLAGISLYWIAGLPTHDATNAFKAYRTAWLRSLSLEGDGGFEISMEITIKTWLAGGHVSELPATWTDRAAGTSKFRMLKWLPKYLHWYLYAIRGRLNNLRTVPSPGSSVHGIR